MFRKRYRTTQLTVETKKMAIRTTVVMLTVSVRLVDKKVNNHVGRVIVVKVMAQIRMLGSIVKIAKIKPKISPRVDL